MDPPIRDREPPETISGGRPLSIPMKSWGVWLGGLMLWAVFGLIP